MDEASLRSVSWFKKASLAEMGAGEEKWKKFPNNQSDKVKKEDARARRHYMKTELRDGKRVKVWQCGICTKEFRFQYTLVRHIPTHTDERKYRCNMCAKAFRQLSTLSQHKATHDNKRPFTCNVCNKSFNRASTLISHKKIHGQEKSHVCGICNKGFHQKGNLKNHMYTHSNARPYKCDVCGKGFNQKSNLTCHKVTHVKTGTNFCKEIPREKPSIKRESFDNDDNLSASSEKSDTKKDIRFKCFFVGDQENQLPAEQRPLEIKLEPESDPQHTDHNILTILKTKPSDEVMSVYTRDGFLFCLLYRPNSIDPIFCKAIPGADEIVVVSTNVNPSKLNIFRPLSIAQDVGANGRIIAKLKSFDTIPVTVDCDEQANNLNYSDYCKIKEKREMDSIFEMVDLIGHDFSTIVQEETGLTVEDWEDELLKLS